MKYRQIRSFFTRTKIISLSVAVFLFSVVESIGQSNQSENVQFTFRGADNTYLPLGEHLSDREPSVFEVPCAQNTKLTGGTELKMNRNKAMDALEGTPYHYEMWVDEGGAHGIKFKWYGAGQGGGAAFSTSWEKPDCYLGRIGYFWGNGQEYTAYKNIYCDFHYTRSGRGTAGNWSYIGIYGWSRNPDATDPNERLIEYYIVDDWFGNQSQSDSEPLGVRTTRGTIIGTITVDGAIYDIHKSLRVQKPSIDGTQTFTQIFSIRRNLRNCGTISVTEHFKKWEELGLKLGNLYEAKFLVEAGSGTGWIDLSYLSFSQEEQPRRE